MTKVDKKAQITFEINEATEAVEIHGNAQSLKELANMLLEIAKSPNDHTHLMTENWGGSELSENVYGEKNKLINQVKIFCWVND